jgi:hypothetical protein
MEFAGMGNRFSIDDKFGASSWVPRCEIRAFNCPLKVAELQNLLCKCNGILPVVGTSSALPILALNFADQ